MRELRGIVVIPDFDVPASDYFAQEHQLGPWWTTGELVRTFFGHPDHVWLRDIMRDRELRLYGERLDIPRMSARSDRRRLWRLYDVERLIYALAHEGLINEAQMIRALEIVRAVAEAWGFVDPRPVPYRVEILDSDNERKGPYVVAQEEALVDDLDKTSPAEEHIVTLDGVTYYLHLSEANWQKVLGAFGPFMRGARTEPASRLQGVDEKRQRDEIRAWARENGFKVANRGAIPDHVMVAYLNRKDR